MVNYLILIYHIPTSALLTFSCDDAVIFIIRFESTEQDFSGLLQGIDELVIAVVRRNRKVGIFLAFFKEARDYEIF